jgi:hypothetical protein
VPFALDVWGAGKQVFPNEVRSLGWSVVRREMSETETPNRQEQEIIRINLIRARPADGAVPAKKKRKSGIPTGNAGEYLVMGELLRRGYDAQLADRNTKAYDLLVGRPEDKELRKVQVKTVREQPWYVRRASFVGDFLDQVTIYVLIGNEDARKPIRYFIVRNREVAEEVSIPSTWQDNASAFMMLKSIEAFENRWSILGERST